MTNLGTTAFSVSRALDLAPDLLRLKAGFSDGIKLVGLTCSACGMVTGWMASQRNPFFFTDWPEDWQALYFASDFLSADPLPRHAIKSGRAITWTQAINALPAKDPGHKVYLAAARWGFKEGAAISFRSSTGDIGLVTMGGDRKPLGPDEMDYLNTLSASAFRNSERLSPLSDLGSSPMIFTDRERDCISLLRAGMTDAEIGRALGIGKTTVTTHLENARRKVNARSRTHLVNLTLQTILG